MSPDRRRGTWVLKLGGSLAGSAALPAWLDVIAAGGGRLIVVPGGGPFADAVRAAQRARSFDDATAHRMAVLAMEQYGLMLAARCPALRPAATRAELRGALRDGGVGLWMPARMLAGREDVEASWDVTSDSLAAWLARELAAACLLLVKHGVGGASEECPTRVSRVPDTAPVAVTALVRDGIVDRAFPRYLARCGCECRLLGADDPDALGRALRTRAPTGVPVTAGGG